MSGNELLEKFRKELSRTEVQIEAGKKLNQNTNKLKDRGKYNRSIISNLERNLSAINRLKTRTYYSIEISNGKCCRHKAIMYVGFNISEVVIFNATYEKMSEVHSIEEIYYFDVLRELDEME